MSGSQTKNSALTTALAFHYQVLIGLDKCFSLQEGQAIWFEKDGDVSLIGDSSLESSQTEVKNYASPLTDHHENLWKTLKNWLDSSFDQNKYGILVLHTTQAFGATTRLRDWNKKTSDQRLQVLKDIYGERTPEELNAEKPAELIKFQKTVMTSEENQLLEVISKVTLFTEADSREILEKNIKARLGGIPNSNLNSCLEGLVGFVYHQAETQFWKIQYTDWKAKLEELTALFCKREFSFPIFNGYEASDLEVEQHQNKLFVQKIYEIEHDLVVSDAVGNWMELQNSLNQELDGFPQYAEKTKQYQNRLVKRFELDYLTAKDELPLQPDQTVQIKRSRKLYNNTIREDALSLAHGTPPIEYKNGLIHDAMDDDERKLKWKVEL